MADVKLSQKTITGDATGGFMYIIKPDGGGGWEGFQIDPAVFAASGNIITDQLVNQAADFTIAVDAGTKLLSIDFSWQAGTPIIKIGTTPGGDEITLAPLPVPNNDFLVVNVDTIFKISTTIYISIATGTVNLNINYIENYF